jgi:hypothetical protein
VGLSVDEITVTPFVSDLSATVKVDGNDTPHATASDPISLDPGENDITVVVTAGDLSTTKTYTVTVNREPSDGTYSISGTIDITSLIIVWWYSFDTEEEDFLYYISGSFPRAYSIDDLPDEDNLIGAFLDKDNDYDISDGDLVGGYPSEVTVAGANVTGIDFTISGVESGTLTARLSNVPTELNGKHAFYGVFNYPPDPEDIPYIFPYEGALAGDGEGLLSGDTLFDIDYIPGRKRVRAAL